MLSQFIVMAGRNGRFAAVVGVVAVTVTVASAIGWITAPV